MKKTNLLLIAFSLWAGNSAFGQCSDPLDVVVSTETICLGEEINLDATSVNDGTISWDHDVVNGETFTPETPGMITYTATSDNPDDCVFEVEITVNALPEVTASADDALICIGEDVVLTGTGADTYVWTMGVVDGTAFSPLTTETYEVTGTDANGCINTASIEVVVGNPEVIASVDAAAICIGEDVVLTGSGAESYSWTMGVVDGEAFAPTTTETYEVTGTDANGCENTATIEVVVNALPIVTAAADVAEICAEEEVVLTGSGAESYAWTMDVVDGEAFSPESTETYEVVGTDANGCENSATIEVVVNTLPEVIATADIEEICIGEDVTLTGSGADSYVWTMDVVDGTAFSPITTETYEVTGTDANGCINTASIEVVVGNPEVTAIADDAAICIGENVVLTGSGAESYTWTMGVVDGEAFAPAATETYEVTGTDANGCENSATIEVVVNALPEVTASVDVVEICEGESIILTKTGDADSYEWHPADIVEGEPYTPVDGVNTFTVKGTIDETGCATESTVTIIINPLPEVTLAVSSSAICEGQSVVFTQGGEADTYSYDPIDVVDGVAYTPGMIGVTTYTVTGTNTTTGCQSTASVDVSVNEYPTVLAGVSSTVICEGESVVFAGSGASTYTWDLGVTNGEDYTPAAIGTTTYTVIGEDEIGCDGTASIDVTVNPVPVVEASSSESEICEGESIILTKTGDADSYEWSPADIVEGTPYTPADGVDTYTLTGTFDETGCTTVEVVTITLNPTPTVSAGAGDGVFCVDESVILSAGGDADVYTWDPTDLEPGLGTHTYTVTGTYDGFEACPAFASVTVTVLPTPEISISTDFENVCVGQEVTLTAAGADEYEWMPGSIENGVGFVPGAVGTYSYTVVGTISGGCTTEESITINVVEGITLSTEITAEMFGNDGEIDLTVSGGIAPYTFEWEKGGTYYDNTEDLTGLDFGDYSVTVVGASGCSAHNISFVQSNVSVDELTKDMVQLYPNPTSDNVTIQVEGTFNYTLTDISGSVLLNGSGNTSKTLSLDGLADGIYFVTLNVNGESITMKVVKN